MAVDKDSEHPPDGLVRVTMFLPLQDDVGIPKGNFLLIGDAEFPELADQPIRVGEIELSGTEGLTPLGLRFWRIEEDDPFDQRQISAHVALQKSKRTPMDPDIIPPADARKRTRLIAEVTSVARRKNGILIGDSLGKSIEIVQRVQTSLTSTVPGSAVEIVTLEQLPFLIHTVTSSGPPAPDGPGELAFVTTKPFPSSKSWNLGVSSILEDEVVERVIANTGLLPLSIALPFFQFRNDAVVQLHRYGNYRQSVIASAAAAENLMGSLLELTLWEEGLSARQAAQKIGARDGIFARTRRELPARLGGTWDYKRPGAIKNWRDLILKLRNLIVHVGHAASRQEALSALATLEDLVGFVGDRLADERVRNQYPRTVILSLGKPSLEIRGAWTHRLEQLRKQKEGEWRLDFVKWRAQLLDLMLS